MTAQSFPSRLSARAYQMNMTPALVAEAAALPRSFVYDILRGRSKKPDRLKLERIADVLQVDVDWLLSGKGEVVGEPPVMVDPEDEFVPIRLAAPRPSMGGGAVVEGEEETDRTYQFRKSWIRQRLGTNPARLRLLHVEGDSMEPTLRDGDMVLVDMGRNMPHPPGIFVLHDGAGLVAKRIEHVPMSDPARIRIVSDNPIYAPYECLVDEVNIVGRIRWYAREI